MTVFAGEVETVSEHGHVWFQVIFRGNHRWLYFQFIHVGSLTQVIKVTCRDHIHPYSINSMCNRTWCVGHELFFDAILDTLW